MLLRSQRPTLPSHRGSVALSIILENDTISRYRHCLSSSSSAAPLALTPTTSTSSKSSSLSRQRESLTRIRCVSDQVCFTTLKQVCQLHSAALCPPFFSLTLPPFMALVTRIWAETTAGIWYRCSKVSLFQDALTLVTETPLVGLCFLASPANQHTTDIGLLSRGQIAPTNGVTAGERRGRKRHRLTWLECGIKSAGSVCAVVAFVLSWNPFSG